MSKNVNNKGITDGVGAVNGEFPFWTEATTLIKSIVKEDVEALIASYMETKGFNINERQLFRHYLTQAFDMLPMMVNLKSLK